MRCPSDSALPGREWPLAVRSPRSDSAAHNLPSATRLAVWLRALPVDEARALLAGRGAPGTGLFWHQDYPMSETLGALAMVVGAHQAVGSSGVGQPKWWLHQIVVDDLVVGDVGFHGPPGDTGLVEVELGYHVVRGLRGQGIATQACGLLLQQAWRDDAWAVRAETEADNVASQRVLLRAGFRDEGGLRFVLTRPEAAP